MLFGDGSYWRRAQGPATQKTLGGCVCWALRKCAVAKPMAGCQLRPRGPLAKVSPTPLSGSSEGAPLRRLLGPGQEGTC